MPTKQKILILGVTASGKGSLGFELARRLSGEIISVDSMKVYRRMNIGTAKPSPEKQNEIRYHLIDVAEPSDSFSVDQFLDLANKAMSEIHLSGKSSIAVGGTAMYIKALLYGLFEAPPSEPAIRNRLKERIRLSGAVELHRELAAVDPQAAERIHPNDERRIIRALEVHELTGLPISTLQRQWDQDGRHDWFIIGLRRTKPEENHRINLRVQRMISEGLAEETKGLIAEPRPLSRQASAAIGYAEMIQFLNGELSFEEAIERIKINTRHLAKSQRTWFKTFKDVHWLDIEENESLDRIAQRVISILPA